MQTFKKSYYSQRWPPQVARPSPPNQTSRTSLLLSALMMLALLIPSLMVQKSKLELMALAEGVKFTNFHASPTSSVTRSMMLTGANSHEVGLGTFDYAVYPGAIGKPGY